jgi:adhesin HecA-like repeat protein
VNGGSARVGESLTLKAGGTFDNQGGKGVSAGIGFGF